VEKKIAATPWVERYRPKNLQEVSHQREVVATLENAVGTGRLPHLLFYGPPGTGKTSVALALCRQLWAPSQWRRRVLELNASDERGISVVRDKIKHFASLAVGTHKEKSASSFFNKNDAENDAKMDVEVENYPNPPFKIIILDEADTVTPDAQAALRRIIEAHSRITRFILICNYVTRIIEPLASRCAKFRFQPLPVESMKLRLKDISTSEGCSFSDDQLENILDLAGGDMRRAVTTLQSAHALGGPLDKEGLAELAGLPPPSVVENLWESFTTFDSMKLGVDEVTASGFSVHAVLVALSAKILTSSALSDLGKAKLAIRIGEVEKNLVDGADEYLQLMTVCSLALTCLEESKQNNKQ